MTPLPAARGNRIQELDGLRAVAVLAVVVNHVYEFSGSVRQGPDLLSRILTVPGGMGVHVFFVISGFIITTLLLKEKERTGRVSLFAFYIRRVFRIVPPFAAFLLSLLALGQSNLIRVNPHDIVYSALFLGNTALIDPNAWFVRHTWSLSVEEQFYAIFPPVLCFIAAFRTRFYAVFLAAAYGLSLLSLKLAHELSIHAAPAWISLAGLYDFRYIIVGVLMALFGGAVLPHLANRSRWWAVLLVVAVFALQATPIPWPAVSVLCAAIEPFLCGLLVMWFMQNPARCAPLRWAWVQWLGACSYSIYLWQQLFTGGPENYPGLAIAQSPLAVLAILPCAAISYYVIERPAIALGHRLSQRVRGPASSRAVSVTPEGGKDYETTGQ